MTEIKKVGYIVKDREQNRVHSIDGIMPTLTANNQGGRRPGGLLLIDTTAPVFPTNYSEVVPVNQAPTKEFTYASAFAGIGGMTMGLQPLGGKGVAAWEFDPTETKRQYAQEAHRLLHPDIPVYGDICDAVTNTLPDFDLFCFTPPCQSFSIAGKRGGFSDTRGTLTFEALRIAKDKQPKLLFMENVKGLVSHDQSKTLSTILHAMNEIGYLVDFTIINSKHFGVAQNRERVYLVAIRNDLQKEEPWVNLDGNTLLPKAKTRFQNEGVKTFNFDWPSAWETEVRLRDIVETEIDEKYYLSEEKTELIRAQLRANHYRSSTVQDVICINPRHTDGTQTKQQERTYLTEGYMTTLQAQLSGRFNIVAKEININTLETELSYGHYRLRKLTPNECLRLQAVPEKMSKQLLESYSDSRIYKFAGNGLTTTVITAIGEKLLTYL